MTKKAGAQVRRPSLSAIEPRVIALVLGGAKPPQQELDGVH